MAPLDKMDPRRAKSAPGAIELNRHFGAETDLLNLQCVFIKYFTVNKPAYSFFYKPVVCQARDKV